MKPSHLLAFLAIGASCLLPIPASLANSTTVDSRFNSIMPRLRGTKTPVLLPTYIPYSGQSKLYVEGGTSENGGYNINLTFKPGCYATPCRMGTISVQKIQPDWPSIAQDAAEVSEAIRRNGPIIGAEGEVPTPVQLSNGIQAHYIPRYPGAMCGDSQVMWEQNGYRYTVALKCRQKQDVLALAGSMIPVTVSNLKSLNSPDSTTTQSTRTIRNQKYGIVFEIPAHYTTRSDGRGDNTWISVLSPEQAKTTQNCLSNRGMCFLAQEELATILITVQPARASSKTGNTLVQLGVSQVVPVGNTTIANQPASVYMAYPGGVGPFRYTSFLTPDQQFLITLYVDESEPQGVVDTFLKSFGFEL